LLCIPTAWSLYRCSGLPRCAARRHGRVLRHEEITAISFAHRTSYRYYCDTTADSFFARARACHPFRRSAILVHEFPFHASNLSCRVESIYPFNQIRSDNDIRSSTSSPRLVSLNDKIPCLTRDVPLTRTVAASALMPLPQPSNGGS
jgi:hypothetical protein